MQAFYLGKSQDENGNYRPGREVTFRNINPGVAGGRKVERSGTTYTMNTGAIGKRPQLSAATLVELRAAAWAELALFSL
jgi:hypothetical protein